MHMCVCPSSLIFPFIFLSFAPYLFFWVFSSDPKHLDQFVEDLKSGKLHMEYHYGSGSETTTTSPKTEDDESVKVGDPTLIYLCPVILLK